MNDFLNIYWILVGLALLAVMFSSVEMFFGIPLGIGFLLAVAYLWDKVFGSGEK